MADQTAVPIAGHVPTHAARLEPDAIGVAQDTVIGMASSAPAASVGLTLAAVAAATAYGTGPIILLTAIPMLIIASGTPTAARPSSGSAGPSTLTWAS
jgi:hypothetical protein